MLALASFSQPELVDYMIYKCTNVDDLFLIRVRLFIAVTQQPACLNLSIAMQARYVWSRTICWTFIAPYLGMLITIAFICSFIAVASTARWDHFVLELIWIGIREAACAVFMLLLHLISKRHEKPVMVSCTGCMLAFACSCSAGLWQWLF